MQEPIVEFEDLLPNPHVGELLREDFLIGSDISVDEVVEAAGVDRDRLLALLDEKARLDAETNLRLARYFGLNDEFLLKLQIDYEVEDAKRSLGKAIHRIVPRAA